MMMLMYEEKYRPWDTNRNVGYDFGFFGGFGLPPLVKDVLTTIHPLSEQYAKELWHWLFASNREVIPLLEKTCWVWKVRDSSPVKWNEEEAKKYLQWADSDTVFFLGRAAQGYETLWNTFRLHTENFIVSTREDGVLFHPTNRDVAVFFEGLTWIGRRSKRIMRKSG